MIKNLPPVFVGHEIYRQAAYGSHHPLAIPRVESAMDLCRALGWLGDEDVRDAWLATLADSPNHGPIQREINELV